VKKTTPSQAEVQASEKKAGEYEFPFFKDDNFNRYLLKFMFSFKNIYSENINGHNVAFITGPSKAGKSWYLRYNIRRFQTSQQNPIVVHYDCRELGMLNFDMFLHSFENRIIDALVKRNKEDLERYKRPLISDKDVLQKVVFRFYDQNLFE
jgi:succinate dehydrogenase flavin-adding protein (antitoxin of CptAB toxin-antitoxin module)